MSKKLTQADTDELRIESKTRGHRWHQARLHGALNALDDQRDEVALLRAEARRATIALDVLIAAPDNGPALVSLCLGCEAHEVSVDEDGCCVTCGGDVVVVTAQAAGAIEALCCGLLREQMAAGQAIGDLERVRQELEHTKGVIVDQVDALEEASGPGVVHVLKAQPPYFESVRRGEKTFEIRRNDRQPPFRVGDVLRLREWRRGGAGYTGREQLVSVEQMLVGGVFGLRAGFVCMSVAGMAGGAALNKAARPECPGCGWYHGPLSLASPSMGCRRGPGPDYVEQPAPSTEPQRQQFQLVYDAWARVAGVRLVDGRVITGNEELAADSDAASMFHDVESINTIPVGLHHAVRVALNRAMLMQVGK